MKFINNISKEEYQDFCLKNKDYHFLQSISWGESTKNGRGKEICYVGLKDNTKLVCATLLIKTNLPFKMCYFYAPRGFIIDFNNIDLLTIFTKELTRFLRDNKAVYLRVNPGIKYQTIDENANKIEDGINNYQIFNNLIKCNYRHNGFNKLYESMEPRYTFRINLKDDFNIIESKMNKTFLKTVRKSYDYDINIQETNDIKPFTQLVTNNAIKDDFEAYDKEYYTKFYKAFQKNDEVKIFQASINPQSLNEKLVNELIINEEKYKQKENVDILNVINRIKKDLNELESVKDKKTMIIGSLICVYTKYNAWTLYIGNNALAMRFNAVNRLYYEAIKDAKKNNYGFIDLFGTVGDPKTKYKNLAGLHEFKRKMGGEYIEFIGDFDLINKKIVYNLRPLISKIYRKLKN